MVQNRSAAGASDLEAPQQTILLADLFHAVQLLLKGSVPRGMELQVRLPTDRHDEIGDVVRNVNLMAESLQRMEGARRLDGQVVSYTDAGIAALQAGCDLVLLCNQSLGDGQAAATVQARELAVLGEGEVVQVEGREAGTRLILVAGQPLREPVARYGPFVMNTQAELRQAFEDYQAGRF